MLYLSKLILNPLSRHALADLRDPYQMHRTLSRAFGQGEAYLQARPLFRVEDDNVEAFVLVQSCCLPQWELLDRSDANDAYLLDKQARDFEPTFTPGQTLGFRLRANPTRRHNGKREGIYLESDRLGWLERKAAEGGFDLVSARVRAEGRNVTRTFEGKTVLLQQVQCRMRPHVDEGAAAEVTEEVGQEAGNGSADCASAGKLQAKASFSAARFDGILQVNDAKRFLETLTAGIGSGKAFGFGLLSVAKA